MRTLSRNFASILIGAVLASPLLTTGCAVHARVYDADHGDYHVWAGETVYYNQWEHDTHRDHRNYDRRSADERKDYWAWPHNHEDHH